MKEIIFDIETTSLNPLDEEARVVAIGVKCEHFCEVLIAKNEKRLLEKFWNLPFFEGYFKLIGFNSFTFDLPYLIIRSFKYGLKIPDIKGRSLDLRFVLSYGNKFAKGKLEDYSTLFLGSKGKKNGKGSNVKELWSSGKYNELKKYCENDVILTSKIHERLKQMGVLQ